MPESADALPVLNEWRQGDLILAPLELPVLCVGDDSDEIEFIQADHGVALVTQSCDIIKSIETRPFVQVAALVAATEYELGRIRGGSVPTRAIVGALEGKGLAIDLEAVSTVKKDFVASKVRTQGCLDDADQRQLGRALGRHRERFAVPDDFQAMVRPVRKWIEAKAGKASSFGRFVDNIREIRVATDSWNNPSEITFIVIVNHHAPLEDGDDWKKAIAVLQDKAGNARGDYPAPEFQMTTLHEISAWEYVSSDRLDMEGLSEV